MTGRLAGVAVPLFSLRSEPDPGIGEFDDLIPFFSWAVAAGQRIIALLPLGEAAPGEGSPYNALSSFALDPLHLRLARIPELRNRRPVPPADPRLGGARVDRQAARAWKEPLFREAFERFRALPESHARRRRFRAFLQGRGAWLDDYSLFRALLEENDWRSWRDWPEALRRRDPIALEEARARLESRTRLFEYLQFVAEEAWQRVRAAARRRGVALMGDLPFAPSENSADVWAHPEVFDVSRSIGAPPDEFSASGQRWGLPMIRWNELRRSGWRWLRQRVRRMAELYDLFRVDHVVGLFRTFYFVGDSPGDFDPAAPEAQAAQGREILEAMIAEGAAAKPIAEDLGTIPPFVRETITALGIPGYKVLRWERADGDFADPSSYPECSVATTGTHDTSTLAEWWAELSPRELTREHRHAILDSLYRSPSRYVILPIQDLFGWRERINLPASTGEGNWTFRLPVVAEKLHTDPAIRRETGMLRRSIDASGRLRRMA